GLEAPGTAGGDGRSLSGHEDDASSADSDLLRGYRGRMHGVLDEHADRGEATTENVGVDASGGIGREVLQEDPASVQQEDFLRARGSLPGGADRALREKEGASHERQDRQDHPGLERPDART